MRRVLLLLLVSCPLAGFGQNANDPVRNPPKLEAGEIVRKHLAAIGTAAGLSAVKSRIMVGTGTFTSKIRPGKIGGPAQLASDDEKILLAIILNSNDYPYEKLAYDGKDLMTAMLPGGDFSALASFLKSNKIIVKRGLFGGVLREDWPLLKPDKDVKLESAGTAKVGDRRLYKLRFSTAGMGDMTISLYFDPETFRHVRTEYTYRIGQITSPNPNRPGAIGATSPSTHTLTEDFSNFAKVDGLILPLTYTVEYTSDAGESLVWTINFSQVFNNQALETSAFKVS